MNEVLGAFVEPLKSSGKVFVQALKESPALLVKELVSLVTIFCKTRPQEAKSLPSQAGKAR